MFPDFFVWEVSVMGYYKDRAFINDIPAGLCLVLAVGMTVIMGQHTMAAFGTFLALIGWMRCGKVSGKAAGLWTAFTVIICLLLSRHGAMETWGEVFFLMGPAVLLYQSLDTKGKLAAREGCLCIAWVLGSMKIVFCYLQGAGYGDWVPELRFFGNIEEAGLFFALAVLSGWMPGRRFLCSAALGLIGSGSGLLGLGFGMLFRKNVSVEAAGLVIGISWHFLPAGIWIFLLLFGFLCLPEIQGSGKQSWVKVSLCILSMCNPWTFSMIKDSVKQGAGLIKGWNPFTGNRPGTEMGSAGIFLFGITFGIPVLIFFIFCLKSFWKSGHGRAWCLSLLSGTAGLFPSVFLFGAGCGMGNVHERKTDSRWFFGILTAAGLFFCSRYP